MGMRFRAGACTAAVALATACVDLSFVEVENPPPQLPAAAFSLSYQPSDDARRSMDAAASFREWGPEPPEVVLGSAILLPLRGESGGNYHHWISDTVAADAPAQLASISFTPPDDAGGSPIEIALPAMQRIGRGVVCPDSAGLVSLGVLVEAAVQDADIYWNVSVSAYPDTADVSHRATWYGSGLPVPLLPIAALPIGDTLTAHLFVGVSEVLMVHDSVPVHTSTYLAENYFIVREPAGAC